MLLTLCALIEHGRSCSQTFLSIAAMLVTV